MLRWPDYFADPPNATTSGDVNVSIKPSVVQSEGSMALLTVKDTTAALIGKQSALVARSDKR